MIDPKKELFKWGPMDGRPIYVDYFMEAYAQILKYFPPGWPDIIFHIKEDRMLAVCDYQDLRNNGEQLFRKYIMNEEESKKYYQHWLTIVKDLENLMKKIDNLSLEELDQEQLKELFQSWHKTYLDFWIYGTLPELSNWGGEQLLKNEILKHNKEHFLNIFERLSAPEDLSFFQKEEYALLQLKLIKDDSEFEEKLKEHQKKYFWIHNNYEDSQILNSNFFKERLDSLSKEEVEKRINLINNFSKKVQEEKENIMEEYKLPEHLLSIGRNLSFCIWWQDLRKKYIFMSNHYLKLFLQEFEKRYNIPLKEFCYYTSLELIDLLNQNKKIDAKKKI